MHIIEKHRQFHKEAWWALALVIFYMIGWLLCAYLPSNTPGLLHFPLWFEMACIYLPILFILVTILVIHLIYKDIDLGDEK